MVWQTPGYQKNFGKTDLYNSGYSFFKGGDFSSSINVFNRYIEKFPQDRFGYYMVGKAKCSLDSTGLWAWPFRIIRKLWK